MKSSPIQHHALRVAAEAVPYGLQIDPYFSVNSPSMPRDIAKYLNANGESKTGPTTQSSCF